MLYLETQIPLSNSEPWLVENFVKGSHKWFHEQEKENPTLDGSSVAVQSLGKLLPVLWSHNDR